MRTLTDIRRELDEAIERRAAIWEALSESPDTSQSAEAARLTKQIDELWDEARAARAYVRFGSLPEISGVLYGVKPVVIAVILQALWGLLTGLPVVLLENADLRIGWWTRPVGTPEWFLAACSDRAAGSPETRRRRSSRPARGSGSAPPAGRPRAAAASVPPPPPTAAARRSRSPD